MTKATQNDAVNPVKSWIGVDFDGTLARTTGDGSLGQPIPVMLNRVRYWLMQGWRVKIFTARVDGENPPGRPTTEECQKLLEAWCQKHLGQVLEITCKKDCHMIVLYDDRAVGIERDTGRIRNSDLL